MLKQGDFETVAISATSATTVGLYARRYDKSRCLCDADSALEIVHEFEKRPGEGWINFPLINQTGDPNDIRLSPCDRIGIFTSHAARMPFCVEVLKDLLNAGLFISHARIAVLFQRSVLRPHVDMFRSWRLLLALTEQQTEFRHIVGCNCLAMRAGEIWTIDGRVCHGAANLSAKRARVTLLIDARPGPLLCIGQASPLPDDHCVYRPPWTNASRTHLFLKAATVAKFGMYSAVEREFLFIPFEFEIGASQTCVELMTFCKWFATKNANPQQQRYWQLRAERIRRPMLSFQVGAP